MLFRSQHLFERRGRFAEAAMGLGGVVQQRGFGFAALRPDRHAEARQQLREQRLDPSFLRLRTASAVPEDTPNPVWCVKKVVLSCLRSRLPGGPASVFFPTCGFSLGCPAQGWEPVSDFP